MIKELLLGTMLLFGAFVSFSQCEDFTASYIKNDPTCNGFTDGSVTAIVSGGSGSIIVEITDTNGTIVNTEGSPTANILGAGWYYYYIVDIETGCELIDSIKLVDPAAINVSEVTVTNHEGPGTCNGSILVEEIPGHDMAELSFIWSPDPSGSSGLGGNELTDACPGTYQLNIISADGCSAEPIFYEVGGETTGLISPDLEAPVGVQVVNGQWIVSNKIQSAEPVMIFIFDLTGKVKYQQKLNNGVNTFELNHNGAVFYKIVFSGLVIKRDKVLNR